MNRAGSADLRPEDQSICRHFISTRPRTRTRPAHGSPSTARQRRSPGRDRLPTRPDRLVRPQRRGYSCSTDLVARDDIPALPRDSITLTPVASACVYLSNATDSGGIASDNTGTEPTRIDTHAHDVTHHAGHAEVSTVTLPFHRSIAAFDRATTTIVTTRAP
jgi:hypothetical protein